MSHYKTAPALTGLLLLTLAGNAAAGESARGAHSPHDQTRGMNERLYERAGRHEQGGWNGSAGHGREDWQHAHRDWDGRGHENTWHHDRDRDLQWGHEHWRESGNRHSWQGRGYWPDYHHGYHG